MASERLATKEAEIGIDRRGEGREEGSAEGREETREEVRPEKRFGAWEESLLPSQRCTESTVADRQADGRYQAGRQQTAGSRQRTPDIRHQTSRGAWREESLGFDLRDEEGIRHYQHSTNRLPILYQHFMNTLPTNFGYCTCSNTLLSHLLYIVLNVINAYSTQCANVLLGLEAETDRLFLAKINGRAGVLEVLLFHCCYTVHTLLPHCCYTVVALFLTLLLHS
jgi:hypothetical protein